MRSTSRFIDAVYQDNPRRYCHMKPTAYTNKHGQPVHPWICDSRTCSLGLLKLAFQRYKAQRRSLTRFQLPERYIDFTVPPPFR